MSRGERKAMITRDHPALVRVFFRTPAACPKRHLLLQRNLGLRRCTSSRSRGFRTTAAAATSCCRFTS